MTQSSLQEALQLLQTGRVPQAAAILRKLASDQPQNADAQHLLGMALFKSGDASSALAPLRRAIDLDPKRPDFHFNLGAVLASMKRHDDAIDCYNRALQLRPEYPQALNNLGNSLRAAGRFDEAAAALRRAIILRPDYFEAHTNLGSVLAALRDYADAVEAFNCAIALRPTPEIYNNLGTTLFDWRRFDKSVDAFRAALKFKPDYTQARRGLADALAARGDLEEAIDLYEKLIAENPPGSDDLHNALAGALKNVARVPQAIAEYRRAVELNPNNAVAHSNLVFCLWYDPAYDPAIILEEHRKWDRQHAQHLRVVLPPFYNTPDPTGRLKIGYVSPDFRQHATSFCTVPLLENHDHAAQEIFCYSSVRDSDWVTQRLKKCADVWRNCADLSDEQLADQIRADHIDILMDLSMHTSENRLLAFARKPAPVQATFIACPGTTGLQTVDYRLTDPWLDPPGQNDAFYSEKSIRLPDSYWCYDPLIDDPPPVQPLPALRNGFITFGSLNKFCKINDGVLALWSRILKSVPNSRILLHHTARSAQNWVLEKLDVDPKRIDFVSRELRRPYLEYYNQIDLCLDTMPYNGHMTSLDALWMGVPVITLVGRTPVGRAGLSLAANLDLMQLCAQTEDDFARIAIDWSSDLQRLSQLRSDLRPRMERSPLMDGPKLARNLESIYRQIWRDWCEANANPTRKTANP